MGEGKPLGDGGNNGDNRGGMSHRTVTPRPLDKGEDGVVLHIDLFPRYNHGVRQLTRECAADDSTRQVLLREGTRHERRRRWRNP